MNILFITQEDPFYIRIFFEEFLEKYIDKESVKGVVLAPTMGKKTIFALAKQMYDFYGLYDFIFMGFRYVYYNVGNMLPDKFVSRKFFSISKVCKYYNVPVYNIKNINDASFIERIKKMNLDLIVSVAAPQVFHEELIKLPNKGCINIHNSKLPKYRGMLPNFWQMYHGEKSVGTTIHQINAALDDGEILLQKDTPIAKNETLDSLIKKTKKYGANMMIEAIKGIDQGTLKSISNKKEDSTYFSFPTREQVREFKRKGFRLL